MALLPLLRLPFAAGLLLLALLAKTTAATAQPTPATNRWDVEPGTAVYQHCHPTTPATNSELPDVANSNAEGKKKKDP